MQISVHSGLLGQTAPYVTIQQDSDSGNCRVTRYIFREYDGGELTVVHFEHGLHTPEARIVRSTDDDDAAIAWEDLPEYEIQPRKPL